MLSIMKLIQGNGIIIKSQINKQENSKENKYQVIQFSSVAQSCPTHCDPMNCSTRGLPVHHQLPESTQTHGIGYQVIARR